MPLDPERQARVRPFVSNLDRPVFALFGLPEEVIAVLFAYYSRSRDDLRTNLARLLSDEQLAGGCGPAPPAERPAAAEHKARAFHEKWVVGYGHASVAEHAIVHLGVEGTSIVASKWIEDLRLGSYTEKSTRYVVFDAASFADLPELPEAARAAYRASCESLLGTYDELFPVVEARVREMLPQRDGQARGAWEAAVRSQTCDLLRGLLPAGTLTNLGVTANARALAMLLVKMLSSPLAEVRRLGAAMRDEALTVAPTLLRHAAPSAYRAGMRESVRDEIGAGSGSGSGSGGGAGGGGGSVTLVRWDSDALERVALALAFEAGAAGGDASALVAGSRGRARLEGIVAAAMRGRGEHDPAPRAFEASSLTVQLELDYGAYRDLQRHRMLAPFTQTLGCDLGAHVPEDLARIGVGERFAEALERARGAWALIAASHPFEAQYAVPLAFRVRTLWTLSLRELFHVVELRTSRQGHASYRRVAQDLYRVACAAHPWLGPLVRVDLSDYRMARETEASRT
jgi:thymidylate synthase ThyX